MRTCVRARDEVQELHEDGLSAAEIARRLGITALAVCHHLRRLGVAADARFSRRYDWAEVQRYLRPRRDLPLTLALHHVNGVGDDNWLENLQLLCPNCHSQTDTFAGRNAAARAPVAIARGSGRA
jgi:hypothetical protein